MRGPLSFPRYLLQSYLPAKRDNSLGDQKARAVELVNGGVLVQTQLRVSDTPAVHYLHVYLNALTRIGHLLTGLGLIYFFFSAAGVNPSYL